MKNILVILFTFLSVNVFAQIPDSVISIYNSARTNSWIQIGSPPSGFTVDSMFVMPIAGQNYLMKDYNKGVFTTRELGIFPNGGSNMFRLQKAANHDSIKQIVLDQYGGGLYGVAGTLNARGKVISKIGNSRFFGITGADTIENAIIQVDRLSQMVDTLIGFKNCRFVYDVSPAIYGADLSGVLTSTKALQMTFNIPDVTISIPKGDTVRIDATVTLNISNNFNGIEGLIIMTDYTMPALIMGGNASASANNRDYTVNVRTSPTNPTLTQWNNANCIGVVFKNMTSCRITVNSRGFREGVRFLGENNTGFAYNNIIGGGNMQNNKIDYRLTQRTGGWCNENEFFGVPRLWVNSGVLPSEARYGIVIDNDSTSNYLNNSNKVYGLSVEKGANATAVLIKDGIRNYIYGVRAEGILSNISIFSDLAEDNFVTASYSGTGDGYIDTSATGTNLFVNAAQMRTSANTSIYEAYRWQPVAQQYDATTTSISGAYIFNATGDVVASSSTVFPRPEYVELGSNTFGIGFNKINTTNQKVWLAQRQLDAGFEGRWKVILYDSSMRELGASVKPQMSASSTYTNGWITQINSSTALWIRVPSAARFMSVAVVRSGSNVRIRGMALHVVSPAARTVTLDYQKQRLAIAQPTTIGTYQLGDIIYNAAADSTTLGWKCVTSGTLRTISFSGSVAAASRNLIAAGHGVAAGEYLNINGVPNQALGIAGDTIYLATASAAFTGTITNSPAGFNRIGTNATGGGGGGGSVTLTGDVTGTGTGTVPTTVSNNAITYAKFQQGVARSILARAANSTGNYSALQSTVANQILYDNGTTLLFGNPPIPYSTVTNVPNIYFRNTNMGDTLLKRLNDSTFRWRSLVHPDTSVVVSRTDSTIEFKLQAGRYAPSRSDFTNIASTSVESFMFTRDGNIVDFSGVLKVTPSSASPATTALDLALPLGPTFTLVTDLAASGSVTTPAVTGNSWTFLINGRTSNGTARVSFTSTGNTEHVIYISGKYEYK